MKRSCLIIALLSMGNSSPPAPIDCDRLQRATAGEFVCEANTGRIAADANRGVYTTEMNNSLALCKSEANQSLLLERHQFIKANKKLIKQFRPSFRMEKASDQEWGNLMYAHPAMCIVHPYPP